MKYKNNILDKLVKLDTTISKMQVQTNRNEPQQTRLDTIIDLKDQVEEIRSMISNESDDFAKQFK